MIKYQLRMHKLNNNTENKKRDVHVYMQRETALG